MSTIFATILNMSMTASVIILAVLLARLCLRRIPKIFSYALWSVVLFRLLCPVSISLPISLLAPVAGASAPSGGSDTASVMEYIPTYRESDADHNPDDGGAVQISPEASISDEARSSGTQASGQNAAVDIASAAKLSAGEIALSVCGYVWLAGAAAFLGASVWQNLRLRRRLSDACLLRGDIFESDEIDTAFVLGVIKPRIYLPLGLPFDVQKAVVAHERTHLRRGDHIVKLVAFGTLAIHWFNPLCWLSFRLMCADMEKSCDEAVISELFGRGYTMESIKKGYGRMLYAFAKGRSLFSPVSFSETGTKERVKNVLGYKRRGALATVAAVLLCLLIVVGCAGNPAATSGSSQGQPNEGAHEITIGDRTFWSDAAELDLSRMDSPDLSLLGGFPNLVSLDLSSCNITDISALASLTGLRSLDLSSNYMLADISPLGDLTGLVSLSLSKRSDWLDRNGDGVDDPITSGNIADFSCLNGLTALESLDLSLNRHIEDISFLRGLTALRSLDLSNNELIKDFSPLGELAGMTSLRLLGVPVTDLSFVARMPALTELVVHSSQGCDLAPLSYCTAMQRLNISGDKSTPAGIDSLRALTDLRSLSMDRVGSIDLSFLQDMTGLKALDLSWNYSRTGADQPGERQMQLTLDFAPLASLKRLEELNLEYTGIDDISFVSGMRELRVLNISCDNVVDISPLAGLDALEELNAHDNEIRDISHLAGKTALRSLDISFNRLDGCGMPPGLTGLMYLNAEYTGVLGSSGLADISELAACGEMRELKLSGNDYSDISALSSMTKLEKLDLSNAWGDELDLSPLAGLASLRELRANVGWQHKDLSFMSGLSGLRTLSLGVNNLTDISALSALTGLETLELSYGGSDISPLSALTGLRSLTLSLAQPDSPDETLDISAIGKLTGLEHLNLSRNEKLSDISPLSGLVKLKKLSLTQCDISDISPLANLNSLTSLNLESNRISDLSPLEGLEGLSRFEGYYSELYINGNDISYEQVAHLKTTIPHCTIYWEMII